MNVNELLDAAIEEIGRVLIGNKDRNTEEVYLKNAIRHIREYGSQPQLNSNQQIVLDYLKGIAVKNDNAPIVTFSAFGYQHFGAELPTDVEKAYQSMNGKQDLGVMSAYVNWALEQEEE
jgi:hypothetical protein